MVDDECIIDCETSYTILKRKIYLIFLSMRKAFIPVIVGSLDLIESSRKPVLVLPNGTPL